MTFHSKNVAHRIRKTLQKLELEMARVECEIAVADEKMKFYGNSSKAADQKLFLEAKIEKENLEVFYNRLGTFKMNFNRKVALVAEKYQGKYAGVFEDFFFKKMKVSDIAEKYDMTVSAVFHLTDIMRKELDDEGI